VPTLGMITVDTVDPRALATWWAERLSGEIVMDADGFFCMVAVPDWSTRLGFQQVEAPTPGKNRIHFDLSWDEGVEREAGVATWVAAGARHLGQRGESDFLWDTFADPEGNEFCVSGAH
jgi:Glyoxalase-like domain